MINSNYVLVQWPESQDHMEEEWFRDEAILALGSGDRTGSSAYFIPLERYLESPINENFKSNVIQSIVEDLAKLYPVSKEDAENILNEYESMAIPFEDGMNIHEHLVDIHLGCKKK